jgi:hypothetical protein
MGTINPVRNMIVKPNMIKVVKKSIALLLLFCVCPAFGVSPEFKEMLKTMDDMMIIWNTALIYKVLYDRGFPASKNMTDFTKEVASVTIQIPNRTIPTKDAWGNDFQYRRDPESKHFWLISYGSDGKPDSGVYDTNGFPNKEKYPPTSDAKSDIILRDDGFVQCEPTASNILNDKKARSQIE